MQSWCILAWLVRYVMYVNVCKKLFFLISTLQCLQSWHLLKCVSVKACKFAILQSCVWKIFNTCLKNSFCSCQVANLKCLFYCLGFCSAVREMVNGSDNPPIMSVFSFGIKELVNRGQKVDVILEKLKVWLDFFHSIGARFSLWPV